MTTTSNLSEAPLEIMLRQVRGVYLRASEASVLGSALRTKAAEPSDPRESGSAGHCQALTAAVTAAAGQEPLLYM